MYETLGSKEQHLRIIKGMVESSDNQFVPMLVCDLEGEQTAIGIPLDGESSKNAFQKYLYQLIVGEKITGFSFTTESWQTKLPNNSKLDLDELMRMNPMDRPHTTECMMVVFSNGKSESTYLASLQTIRGRRIVGEWEEVPQSGLDGRFTHIWKMAKSVCN